MPGWTRGKGRSMLEKFADHIRRQELLRPGMRLLVAISGGLDSVVLLDLLAQLATEWRLELTAAHFNHQLRGAEADRDEVFVRALCAGRAIPCETGRGDVRAFARANHLSIEAAGRALRYDFLLRTARQCGCAAIVTAHHAGDQAETVLDRLIRGAGVRGLAGISPRSLIAAAPDLPSSAASGGEPPAPLLLLRPLLFAGRTEIAAHAAARGLEFRADTTNSDRRIRRNRIRHELLPLLSGYNPAIEAVLGRTAGHMRELEEYLCGEARAALSRCAVEAGAGKIILEKESFLSYFTLLQKYLLREAWERIGGDSRDLDEAFWPRWEQFLAAGRTDRGLAAGSIELWLTEHRLVLLAKRPAAAAMGIPAAPGRYLLWDGMTLEINRVAPPLELIEKNRDSRLAWIDAGLVGKALQLRPPRPGDRLRPLGLKGSKKVADLLAGAEVPVYERGRIPLLCSGDEIVWICGIRAAGPFRVTPRTTNIYQLKVDINRDSAL